MTTTVFVSGATGFIAQHIINLLIEKGYNVIGSVRSTSKGEVLRKHFGPKFSFEIVEDLQKPGAFEKALAKHPESTIFLHTASPVVFSADDPEKEIIIPAIVGTKNALEAIKTTAPQIKKVVLTSSIVSQLNFFDPLDTADETSWSKVTYEEAVLNGMVAYSASKKFAEKAAWEFVLREKPNFTLTTIHPVVVFGPQVIDEFAKGDLNLSNSFISDLLKLKGGDTVPEFGASSIDVRDVAKAHLVAFEKDDSAGKRLIVSNELFTNQTLLDIINKDVPKLKGKVVKGVPGSQPIPKSNIDDKKSREFLGIKYISLRDSVVNTLDQYTKVNGL